ncbi:MAG: hypothetical protein AAGC55_23070 [Myxococcota bacterium]
MRNPLAILSRGRRSLSEPMMYFTAALMLSAAVGVVILLFFPGIAGLYLFGLYSIPSNSM